jgi:Predicted metal-binding integral membrane protein (DUF2182)
MTAGLSVLRQRDSERSAAHEVLAVASLMFAASTTLTIVWCAPMGVMDLRVMAVVTTAMTAERFAPAGERVARAIGVLVVCAGVLMLAQAAALQ